MCRELPFEETGKERGRARKQEAASQPKLAVKSALSVSPRTWGLPVIGRVAVVVNVTSGRASGAACMLEDDPLAADCHPLPRSPCHRRVPPLGKSAFLAAHSLVSCWNPASGGLSRDRPHCLVWLSPDTTPPQAPPASHQGRRELVLPRAMLLGHRAAGWPAHGPSVPVSGPGR